MNLTPIKTPLLVKRMFPDFIWEMPSVSNTIYLTFDDGPTPDVTSWTLDILKHYNATATFFCIGNNVKNYPDIYEAVISAGHVVGNHSYDHIKGWNTSLDDYIENVQKASHLINSKLFRPPYGRITSKQGSTLTELGYKVVMWDVLSFDWDARITEKKCMNNVVSKAKPGSIIVFHDSLKASKNMTFALPEVLEHFSKKGFEFKGISL